MTQPLLFEINTRCWLRALSDRLGRPVTLATAPEEEIASWKKRGFTHIWLMGVWATGPKTREVALTQPDLRARSAEGLRQIRAKLRQHDLQLVLDFVPNHVGLDHRWLTEKNSLFVRSPTQR